MNLGIEGKSALVLAAGGGLGRAIATTLAQEGARVAVTDIDAEALRETVSQIEQRGGQALGVPADMSKADELLSVVSQTRDRYGPVDILINNSGGPPPSPVSGIAPETWRTYFESMVLSLLTVTDLVLPDMRTRKWGRIVTSTSSGVIAPIPNLGLSNALRSTLLGWSKTLAREVAADNVTVNVVLPGRVATQRIRQLDEARAKRENTAVDRVVADSVSTIPVGRYGDPQEYADVVAFLASARASYVTGSVIRVDGGMLANI